MQSQIYNPKVIDHFTNPRNVGEITDADGIGEVGNRVCGDTTVLFIKVDNGIIKDVKFKTYGCGAAIASSSMLTELVKGKSIEDALKITSDLVAHALDGLPPQKLHCSNIAADALRAAIEDYQKNTRVLK